MGYQVFLLALPILLFSVIAHEFAHGYAALKQGDQTALMLGRLTFNPLKHIDPFLTFLMPFLLWKTIGIALGGAKPVPVNPRNYRNFKRGDIIVSLAGIATNFVLALVCVPLVMLMGLLGRLVPGIEPTFGMLQAMFVFGIELNLLLAAFNLIPIPPLDGSHVMKYLLPPAWSLRYQQAGRYGLIVLVAVMYFAPHFLGYWLFPTSYLAQLLTDVTHGTFLPSAMPWISGLA